MTATTSSVDDVLHGLEAARRAGWAQAFEARRLAAEVYAVLESTMESLTDPVARAASYECMKQLAVRVRPFEADRIEGYMRGVALATSPRTEEDR